MWVRTSKQDQFSVGGCTSTHPPPGYSPAAGPSGRKFAPPARWPASPSSNSANESTGTSRASAGGRTLTVHPTSLSYCSSPTPSTSHCPTSSAAGPPPAPGEPPGGGPAATRIGRRGGRLPLPASARAGSGGLGPKRGGLAGLALAVDRANGDVAAGAAGPGVGDRVVGPREGFVAACAVHWSAPWGRRRTKHGWQA